MKASRRPLDEIALWCFIGGVIALLAISPTCNFAYSLTYSRLSVVPPRLEYVGFVESIAIAMGGFLSVFGSLIAGIYAAMRNRVQLWVLSTGLCGTVIGSVLCPTVQGGNPELEFGYVSLGTSIGTLVGVGLYAVLSPMSHEEGPLE